MPVTYYQHWHENETPPFRMHKNELKNMMKAEASKRSAALTAPLISEIDGEASSPR